MEAFGDGAAFGGDFGEFVVGGEFGGERWSWGGFEVIGGEEFGDDFDGLADAIAVAAWIFDGEDFHAIFDGVLAGGEEFAFGGALASFLAINLDDAESADGDWGHVRLVAEDGDGDFGFVAWLADIELNGGVVDRGVVRGGEAIEIDEDIAVGVFEGDGEGDGDGGAIDLESDGFFVIGLGGGIEADELAIEIAAEEAFFVVAKEEIVDEIVGVWH